MEFDFQKKEGTGVSKLLTFVSAEAQEIIVKLLIYDHSQRMSAGQALRHAYFKDLREADKSLLDNQVPT
jgi:renal tumor antigen